MTHCIVRVIRCRAGAQAAQEALPKLWPPNQATSPGQAINQISICGEKATAKVLLRPLYNVALVFFE